MRDGGRISAAIDVLGRIETRHLPVRQALKSWGEDAGADDPVVEDVVALEGLAAAVTDHPAHRLRGQLEGKPHIGRGAARLVLAANEVVSDHELFDTALQWARKLAGQAPLAVEQIKRVSAADELDAGLDAEKRGFASVLGSEDAREGISAFLEKRSARFEGK